MHLLVFIFFKRIIRKVKSPRGLKTITACYCYRNIVVMCTHYCLQNRLNWNETSIMVSNMQQIPERWAGQLGWSSWDTERPGQLWKVHYHPLYHSTQARYRESVKILLTGTNRGIFMRGLILVTHCLMEDLQNFGSCLSGWRLHRIHSFNVCNIIEVNELSGDLDG